MNNIQVPRYKETKCLTLNPVSHGRCYPANLEQAQLEICMTKTHLHTPALPTRTLRKKIAPCTSILKARKQGQPTLSSDTSEKEFLTACKNL